MSLGLQWVLTSILMGILVGNMTHKSGSPADKNIIKMVMKMWTG